jgi:hypothetical protein
VIAVSLACFCGVPPSRNLSEISSLHLDYIRATVGSKGRSTSAPRIFTAVVIALMCSQGPQEGALSVVCPPQIRVTSIRCSASFPEARLWPVANR